MTQDEEQEYARVVHVEEMTVERVLTVEEIFEAGYTYGQARAGLASTARPAYELWLVTRYERRERLQTNVRSE